MSGHGHLTNEFADAAHANLGYVMHNLCRAKCGLPSWVNVEYMTLYYEPCWREWNRQLES